MEYVIGIVIFVLFIAISIALHEMGHMVPAKIFGVRVSQFMVGFGKTLWSRERGETEYGIKAIPLGGYVRLVGMMPPAHAVKEVRGGGWAAQLIRDSREVDNEQIEPGEEHRAFYLLSWWKKVIVMAGGPLVNLALALVLFAIAGSVVGLPATAPVVESVVPCAVPAVGVACEEGDPPSAALLAGLEPGDRVLAIDGEPIESWAELTATTRDGLGSTLLFDVERDGEVLPLAVTPTARQYETEDDEGNPILDANGEPVLATVGFLGMAPGYDLVREPWTFGATEAWRNTKGVVDAVIHLPQNVAQAGRATLGQEERSSDGVVSVVGVALGLGQIFSSDTDLVIKVLSTLYIIAAVNLALFVFNMIPLLPLDGGHIASALWQAVKNGSAKLRGAPRPAPVDVARLMPLAYGMFALLIGLGAILIVADIVAPVQIL